MTEGGSMREIMIRFWDKKLEVMWEPIELSKLLSYLLFQSMPNSDGYCALKDHFEEMVPLESAGFPDRDGRNVFKGDIGRLAIDDDLYEIGVIDFFQGCFIFTTNSGMQYPNEYLMLGVFDGYIIGNRFENPDLLETP